MGYQYIECYSTLVLGQGIILWVVNSFGPLLTNSADPQPSFLSDQNYFNLLWNQMLLNLVVDVSNLIIASQFPIQIVSADNNEDRCNSDDSKEIFIAKQEVQEDNIIKSKNIK